jgi:hypothetical protein
MNKLKKNELLIGLLLILLIARDIPFVNLLSVNRIWVGYIILLVLFIVFNFPTDKVNYLVFFVVILLFGIIFTILNIPSMADVMGVTMYIFLWLVAIAKIIKI